MNEMRSIQECVIAVIDVAPISATVIFRSNRKAQSRVCSAFDFHNVFLKINLYPLVMINLRSDSSYAKSGSITDSPREILRLRGNTEFYKRIIGYFRYIRFIILIGRC